MIALVVVTDGRDYLWDTLASAQKWVLPEMDHTILVDDSGAGAAASVHYSFAEVVQHPQRLGLAAAVRSGWEAATQSGADFVFHLEDDFVFKGRVPVGAMCDVLEQRTYLSQIVLKRQAWSPEEMAAGGLMEKDPDDYREIQGVGERWCEHRRIYSLNPHLVPRRVFENGWPPGNEAEQTYNLNDDPRNRFAIWGGRHKDHG